MVSLFFGWGFIFVATYLIWTIVGALAGFVFYILVAGLVGALGNHMATELSG